MFSPWGCVLAIAGVPEWFTHTWEADHMLVVQSRMVGASEVLIWYQKLGMFPESHWSSVDNGITKNVGSDISKGIVIVETGTSAG